MKNYIVIFCLSFSFSLLGNPSSFKPIKINEKEGYQKVQSKTCDVHLSFGSYGSGTPYEIIKKIKGFLSSRKDILQTFSWSWGKEGENDLCLILSNPKKSDEYYSELKKIIPEYSKKGYTRLKTKSGKAWSTTWPK